SRKYFSGKFKEENIDARFDNYSLETLDSLPALVRQQNISGFAITIPHKKNIIPYLHYRSNAVSQMNACNCVRVKEGKWYGYNTDITGFENSFLPLLKPYHTKALVLGTGGAAAAVEYVLKKQLIPFKRVSRSKKEHSLTYEDLDESLMDSYKIIINCSPVGTFPAVEEAPAIPYQFLKSEHYLYDLIYNPTETLFLKKGKEKQATVKNGYEMLVLQAEENWKIWNDSIDTTDTMVPEIRKH
ncbi:MAG: shikimate dehydrogenase, partial [Chitinophagaceae bacterium]|nr:shikimate dehydrogenase [Chitinophagaceae bacterium]